MTQPTITDADRLCASRMVTKDHLGQAILRGECDDLPAVREIARHREAAVAQARQEDRIEGATVMQEAAVNVCREQQQSFLSPEYATGQPLSSLGERFACGLAAEAIAALDPSAMKEVGE